MLLQHAPLNSTPQESTNIPAQIIILSGGAVCNNAAPIKVSYNILWQEGGALDGGIIDSGTAVESSPPLVPSSIPVYTEKFLGIERPRCIFISQNTILTTVSFGTRAFLSKIPLQDWVPVSYDPATRNVGIQIFRNGGIIDISVILIPGGPRRPVSIRWNRPVLPDLRRTPSPC